MPTTTTRPREPPNLSSSSPRSSSSSSSSSLSLLHIDDFVTDLEVALNDALPSDDPFDDPSFDAVEFINRRFPNEQSLSKVDLYIVELQEEVIRLDSEILTAVRKQAMSGARAHRDLESVKNAIRELFERIISMKEKATESESLVEEICRDIKSLDHGKMNLTATIISLKRLVMLVTALDQLRGFAAERKYNDAANLILAVQQLCVHFDQWTQVPKIDELMAQKKAIFTELQKQVLEDFDTIFDPDVEQIPNLLDACLAVDAISSEIRREIVTKFCLKILEPYKKLFQPPHEASSLESVERRYVWLKRQLREFEDSHAKTFPPSWNVPCSLCEHFCHITRQHLVEVLSNCHHTVEPTLLVRVLHKSIEFEDALAQKFQGGGSGGSRHIRELLTEVEEKPSLPVQSLLYPEALLDDHQHSSSSTASTLKLRDELSLTPTSSSANSCGLSGPHEFEKPTEKSSFLYTPRFRGIISECFEAYLGTWIHHEEEGLMDALSQAAASDVALGEAANFNSSTANRSGAGRRKRETAGEESYRENISIDSHLAEEEEEIEEEEEEEDIPRFVYSSASEVFSSMKSCIDRTTAISTHQTLYEIFQTFKRIIKRYTDLLTGRLPKKGISLTTEVVKTVCCVVGTAEYCEMTLPELSQTIVKVIDESYGPNVNFESERDLLWNIKANGIQMLVASVEILLDPSFSRIIRTNWVMLQEVVDASSYVSEITQIINQQLSLFASYLSVSYYRFLCDKLAQFFIPKFVASVYSSKKVGELGAQQLLLDAYSLKSALLEIPVIAGGGRPMPSGYSKFVVREMGRAEVLLKVLTSSVEDPSSFKALLEEHGAVGTSEELHKILALKPSVPESGGAFASINASTSSSSWGASGGGTSSNSTAGGSMPFFVQGGATSYGGALSAGDRGGAFGVFGGGTTGQVMDVMGADRDGQRSKFLTDFQSFGDTLREQGWRATVDMRSFLGKFTKNKGGGGGPAENR